MKTGSSYMKLLIRTVEKYLIYIISLGFIVWGIFFIMNSSFIGIDGKRYYSLFDDAMISMRYAWNFSHGMDLVWNTGERIQGYTNLLMTLLMSFSTLIFDKSDAVFFVQVVGVAVMILTAHVSMKIADLVTYNKGYQRQNFVRLLAFIGTFSYYPLTYWTLMGMETGLLTLMLALGIFFALKFKRDMKPYALYFVSVSLGLAFMTRNDSLIYAVFIWLYIFVGIFSKQQNHTSLFRYLLAIGIYVFFIFGQLGFQYLYYDSLMPNTYTLKLTGMPIIERIINGIGFIQPFLNNTVDIILILLFVDLFFGFQKKKLLFLSIFLAAISYQVYIGGDPWHYWRIMAPAMPLVILSVINIADDFIHILLPIQSFGAYFNRNPILPKKHVSTMLISLLFVIMLLPLNWPYLLQITLLQKPFDAESNQLEVNTAIVLNQLLTTDGSVGVFRAGVIPYYTDLKAIDFLGKSDKYIAQLPPDMSGNIAWSGMTSVPGHNKYDLNYSIKKLRPTYIQGFQWGTQDLSQWVEKNYINVEYNGISIFLLKNSKAVRWDIINNP